MGTKRCPEEFRREAVELARSSDRPRYLVAESLGVSDRSLAAWMAEFAKRDEPGALNDGERGELMRLRKELDEVKEEREILRKAAQYFGERDETVIRCRFVDDHRAEHSVSKLCELVDLPRATFYRWAKPVLSERFMNDAHLTNKIITIHRQSRNTHGSPRVWGQLRRSGVRVGQKRVARLMVECGLVGAHSRRKWRRGSNTGPAGDLLERKFTADRSDLHWVGDITEFKCVDGKLFPCRDHGPARPEYLRLVDGRTLNHRPGRQRAGHGIGSPRSR